VRPFEWLVASVGARALGGEAGRIIGGRALMGEPVWRPFAPAGFADDEGSWVDGMGVRLDIANSFAERVADRVEPGALLETALGPLASPETRQAVARAESRQQALALALMSPEFQRR